MTTALVEGVETSISFKHNNHDYTTKVTLAAPKVLSVEAPNAKQVVVKFNRVISADSVIEDGKLLADTVKVVPVSGTAVTVVGSAASLNEAGTELTITLDKVDTDYLKGQYTVVVSDSVLTSAGTKVATYTTLLTVADTVAPTVKAINAVAKESTKEVFVQFSEPVKQYSFTATINGASVGVSKESADTFKLTTNTALKTGTANDVVLNKVTDFAGNVASTLKTSVTVVADTAAPTIVSVTPESDNYVKVKFNKKVNAASFKGNVSLLKADGDKVGNMNVITTDDSDTIKLQVPSAFNFPQSGTFTGTLSFAASVRDTLGNTLGSTVTQAVTFVKDTTAPTVVSATYGSSGLVLTFSEDVVLATGSVSIIDESTGTVVGSPITQADMTVKGAKVTVKTSTALGGDYTVRLTAGLVKDKARTPNTSGAATVALTAEKINTNDDKRPSVTKVVYETTSSQVGYHQFTVTATDNVGLNVASLRDSSSYVLNGAALPTGSYAVIGSIGANDTATKPATANVHVFIPVGGITETKDYTFKVVGISDAAGNGMENTASASVVHELKNTTAPKLTEAAINSNVAYLTLTFSNKITSVNPSDFDVVAGLNGSDPNKTTVVVKATVGSGSEEGKVLLQLNVDGKDITDLNTLDSLTVEVKANATTADKDGLKVEKGNKQTVR